MVFIYGIITRDDMKKKNTNYNRNMKAWCVAEWKNETRITFNKSQMKSNQQTNIKSKEQKCKRNNINNAVCGSIGYSSRKKNIHFWCVE